MQTAEVNCAWNANPSWCWGQQLHSLSCRCRCTWRDYDTRNNRIV